MKEVRPLTPEELNQFNTWYQVWYPTVLSVARQMVEDPNIAEVVAQETFITAWEHFDRFQNSENPPGWLILVARNKCRQALRDRKEYLRHNLPMDVPEVLSSVQECAVPETLVPELPEKVLLKRFYEEGYTLRELAKEYNVSLSTIKMRLKRARDKMKAEILKDR